MIWVKNLDTQQIMEIALDMAELEEIPGDSGIHVPGTDINRILIGIDMGTAELLLAKQLNMDLVIAHHPPGGTSRMNFDQVILTQVDQMMKAGVPAHIAEKAIEPRLATSRLYAHVSNYDQVISAARLLEMPFMNIHLPLDLICKRRFDATIENSVRDIENPIVQDAIDAINNLPELKLGMTEPIVHVGSSNNHLGKWIVAMAGGTNGGAGVAKAYFNAGYSTVFYMHIGESDKKDLASYSKAGNLIATGHIASDSVGIAPFVHKLRDEGLDVTTMSGVFIPE